MSEKASRIERHQRQQRLEQWERRQHKRKARRHHYRRKVIRGVFFGGLAIVCLVIALYPAQLFAVFGVEPLATLTTVLTLGMSLYVVLFVLTGAVLLWRALDIPFRSASAKDRVPAVDARTIYRHDHDYSHDDGGHETEADGHLSPKPEKRAIDRR